jgi:hypothetical protein
MMQELLGRYSRANAEMWKMAALMMGAAQIMLAYGFVCYQ